MKQLKTTFWGSLPRSPQYLAWAILVATIVAGIAYTSLGFWFWTTWLITLAVVKVVLLFRGMVSSGAIDRDEYLKMYISAQLNAESDNCVGDICSGNTKRFT